MKSTDTDICGSLCLVATPIGNLEDMSVRAVRALKEADLIAAEDTRNTVHLLSHFDIHTKLTSYHEFNRIEKAKELIRLMKEGKNIALVSDAGLPAISDPGEDIVRMSWEAGLDVTIVPGPCACVSALAISGLSTKRFVFEAFLPRDKNERAEILEELKQENRTIVIYEAPHRLAKTLGELKGALGDNRKISLVREISKVHEETIQTTLGEAEKIENIRGEYVLVIEGRDRHEQLKTEQESWQEISLEEHVKLYENQGIGRKEAMRLAAKDRGISKREIYQEIMKKD